MSFTPRQTVILTELLKEKTPIQTAELAKRLDLSMRTIQRELGDMEKEAVRCGVSIERSRTKGIWIAGAAEDIAKLSEELRAHAEADPGDKTSRRRMLLFMLLKDREPQKLLYYSTKLGVSEATVASDIEALLPWFEKNHLTVIRRQGYGVVLSGSEKDYREAMRRFIHENGGSHLASSAKLSEASVSEALINESTGGIYELLDTETMRRVDEVLAAMDEPRLARLTENAYAGLMAHIAISIERLKQGGRIEVATERLKDLPAMEDYDLAKRILAEMEEEFEIAIPEEEVSYILLHIQGAKLAYSKEEDSIAGGLPNEKLLLLIDRMIEAYDPLFSAQLKQDDMFVHGLMVHLGPVIVRLKEGMNIFNPLLSEIREEYADVFVRCKIAAQAITEETGIEVSDEEIGFLAMHFGAAQERANIVQHAVRRVHIGIVCASGFGVAQLMSAKLEVKLKDGAKLFAYGREELNGDVIEETDFFVSTMNLDDYGVDHIIVSPMITAEDLKKIEHKMMDYARTRRKEKNADRLDDIRRTAVISQDILDLIAGFRRYEIAQEITFAKALHNLSIRVTGSLETAEQAASDLLAREQLNTQIFPELGIALLHTRTKAVKKAAFVICLPRNGGIFSDPYFKGTKAIVFMLCPNDESRAEHARVLGAISAAFVEEDAFLELVLHGEEEAIRRKLEEILTRLFYSLIEIK